MKNRQFWLQKIKESLRRKSVVWLSGVRRAGKTCLCQSLKGAEYFDCELPRVRRTMEDPQSFWDTLKGKTVILDEVHRLAEPSQLLKIAADHYQDIRVIATGSSTLGATAKFKDTLTDRKSEIWLTPMVHEDMRDFGEQDWRQRFLRGGLPGFFLADTFPEKEYQEWIDAFWAKDIQELFRLERRHSFLKFFELLMVQSGGIFEASSFAAPCEVSRPTISNYLSVMEATYVVHVLRPMSKNPSSEIIAAPKVYAFDTGFVCYFRGWDKLRDDDMGHLWEHVVLNELHAHLQRRDIYYWRDKRGNEVDFVLAPRGKSLIAIECKWKAAAFDGRDMAVFLRKYPQARVMIVASDIDRAYERKINGHTVKFVSLDHCLDEVSAERI